LDIWHRIQRAETVSVLPVAAGGSRWSLQVFSADRSGSEGLHWVFSLVAGFQRRFAGRCAPRIDASFWCWQSPAV